MAQDYKLFLTQILGERGIKENPNEWKTLEKDRDYFVLSQNDSWIIFELLSQRAVDNYKKSYFLLSIDLLADAYGFRNLLEVTPCVVVQSLIDPLDYTIVYRNNSMFSFMASEKFFERYRDPKNVDILLLHKYIQYYLLKYKQTFKETSIEAVLSKYLNVMNIPMTLDGGRDFQFFRKLKLMFVDGISFGSEWFPFTFEDVEDHKYRAKITDELLKILIGKNDLIDHPGYHDEYKKFIFDLVLYRVKDEKRELSKEMKFLIHDNPIIKDFFVSKLWWRPFLLKKMLY
jgi:hypothetical protein